MPSVRTGDEPELAVLLGGKTASEDGTDGSSEDPAVAPIFVGSGSLTTGVGGFVGVLSQAPRDSTPAQSAIKASGLFMKLSCWWVARNVGALSDAPRLESAMVCVEIGFVCLKPNAAATGMAWGLLTVIHEGALGAIASLIGGTTATLIAIPRPAAVGHFPHRNVMHADGSVDV